MTDIAIVALVWVACLIVVGALGGSAKDRDRRLQTGELPDAARRLRALADEDHDNVLDLRLRAARLRSADQLRRSR